VTHASRRGSRWRVALVLDPAQAAPDHRFESDNALVSYVVRAVTPDLWPSLEDLFEKRGASNGCWCMYWRIGPEYRIPTSPA
jgi:hypothetical protein